MTRQGYFERIKHESAGTEVRILWRQQPDSAGTRREVFDRLPIIQFRVESQNRQRTGGHTIVEVLLNRGSTLRR